jgi:hypothetical protein
MSTTVDIIIRGISICYRKGDVWKILFPIDDLKCHKINFSVRKEDGKDEAKGFLADAPSINLSVAEAESETGESTNFANTVYDLTGGHTHPKVRLKPNPGKFVLMTVPNAYFFIDVYLEDISPDHQIPALVDVGTSAPGHTFTSLAHSAKAIIRLKDGGTLTLKAGGFQFTTEPGSSYTLTFDNDCDKIPTGENDMDMFYTVIEEFDPATGLGSDKQFRIGGVGPAEDALDERFLENFSEKFFERFTVFPKPPPDFARGNTCMFGRVSDTESIENLP